MTSAGAACRSSADADGAPSAATRSSMVLLSLLPLLWMSGEASYCAQGQRGRSALERDQHLWLTDKFWTIVFTAQRGIYLAISFMGEHTYKLL